LLFSNAKIERRPFIDPAFGPDPAAMAPDHAPHRGKVDSDTFDRIVAHPNERSVSALRICVTVETRLDQRPTA
jgi:hypothetical protein